MHFGGKSRLASAAGGGFTFGGKKSSSGRFPRQLRELPRRSKELSTRNASKKLHRRGITNNLLFSAAA